MSWIWVSFPKTRKIKVYAKNKCREILLTQKFSACKNCLQAVKYKHVSDFTI